MVPTDLLDADLEVALEVLMELLDFRRAVPLLLTVEVGYYLEVEVVDWNCQSVDHSVALLLGGGLLLLDCSLDLGFHYVHCRLDCLDHRRLTLCLHCWILSGGPLVWGLGLAPEGAH